MTHSIRTLKGNWRGERMQVKTFKTSEAMHAFLNQDDNALHWRMTTDDEPTKRGTYVFAGGNYHDVRTLDPIALAHI